MNRIDQLFNKKKEGVLSVYFTAGYPEITDTMPVLLELEKSGADLVEIGIPFSDPVADGPVIQKSSQQALENGMSMELLFSQLQKLREFSQMPVVLMGYINPVFRMGINKFLEKCRDTGIDGVIIPDFPVDEYKEQYREAFRKAGVHNILLVTPQCSDERIRELDDLTGGFLYFVSSYSTTGNKKEFEKTQLEYFERLRNMKLKHQGLIGFGISDYKNFIKACDFASGGIVGSAFINALGEKGRLEDKISNFVDTMLNPQS